MKIIDTHVHIWDLKKASYPWLEGDGSILNRSWEIEELETARQEAGISNGILVQAGGNNEDTDLMLETAQRTPWISGVVAWLPLTKPETARQILEERFLKNKYIRGIRHQVHDEKDPRWLLQPSVIESLKMLASHDIPYDVVAVHPQHIETVLELATLVPELRMVIDHLAWPPITTRERFGKWGELMKAAAARKNIYAKISGLGTASGDFQNRTAADIKPYIAFALEHFGSGKCFCGGDWPVSMLAAGYKDTWQLYKNILTELLTAGEKEKVFYSNAVAFYNLQTD